MDNSNGNWVGDSEAQQASGGSARRKRMNESGGNMQVEATTTNYQGVDDFKDTGATTDYVNASLPHEESHTRSLVKGFTWRCLATTTTVVIAWFVTGEVAQAFKIGFVEFFAKLAIYYAHERVWTKIRM
jgi:uncharacterized membrane protein